MNFSSRIALITVLFNCEKFLSFFFQCMGRQIDRDFLIIIIDNASGDASLLSARKFAAEYDVPCEFIENAVNLGIAAGNNLGIERARELGLQHVVLINNDIGCSEDLIARIRGRAIDSGRLAWTCLAYYGDSGRNWYGGGRLSWWRARGVHFDQERSGHIVESVQVSYAPTCLMYLHMSVFDRIGIMDERYFVYYDDTDFCRRMYDAGIPLTYDPTVSFRHYVGGSSGGELSQFFLRINTRNKFLYIRKHYRRPQRWLVEVIALVSKLTQLASRSRRQPTWQGLVEGLRLPRG